jgi:hypothetical protein
MKAFVKQKAEVEPHSGDVEIESSGKGIWNPEEHN